VDLSTSSHSNPNARPESFGPLLSVGESIGGRFVVESFARHDFTGDVYLAKDSQSDRVVECLIIQLPPDRVKRLLALREDISEVKRVNIKSFANTYGIGKQGGQGYMVRQHLEGRTLTDYLTYRLEHNKPFKQRALCSLLIEMIQGLEALKGQEPAVRSHGLLRPSAILIQNKSKPRVRMTDLGLSVLREDLIGNLESDEWTRGCVPELRGGATPADPDLYCLGALLFEMTQLRPFSAEWRAHFSPWEPFPRLAELIMGCTAETPRVTLLELKEDLKEAARAQVEDAAGFTDDLSQLQERLQRIMVDEGSEEDAEGGEWAERAEGARRAGPLLDGSFTAIFNGAPDERSAGERGDPSERELFKTPLPMSFATTPAPSALWGGASTPIPSGASTPIPSGASTPIPSGASTPISARTAEAPSEGQVDMSHFNIEGLEPGQPSAQGEEAEEDEDLLSSAKVTQHTLNAKPTAPKGASDLLSQVETIHGLEPIDDPDGLFSSAPATLGPGSVAPPSARVPAPPPPPAATARALDASAPRWLVMRGGVDYGPFSQDQITQQLFSQEITTEAELCDIETNRRAALADFPSFEEVLVSWGHKRAELEALRIERERRQRARRRVLVAVSVTLIGALSVGAFLYGPQLYESTLPTPAQVNLDEWKVAVPAMSRLERLEESPEVIAERQRRAQEARARVANELEMREMQREAREASTSEVDLNAKSVGRAFSQKDFKEVLSARMSALTACVQEEMKRSPSVSTFKVTLTVQSSGRFLNARFVEGSDPGQRCVFRAINKLKMEPFDGTDRSITIPFAVR
jgi:serine/threonine protein kinase